MSCIEFWTGNPQRIGFKFSNDFVHGTDFIISAFTKEGKLLFTDRYSNGNIQSLGNNEYLLPITGAQTMNMVGDIEWWYKVDNLNNDFVNGDRIMITPFKKPKDIDIR